MLLRKLASIVSFFVLFTAFSTKAFVPDHYMGYSMMSFSKYYEVFLRDQFISGQFGVYRANKLFNPSSKVHMLPDGQQIEVGVNNRKLHYMAYDVSWNDPVPETKQIRITNQFEDNFLNLETYPVRLMAPAAKRHRPIWPPVVDPVLVAPGVFSAPKEFPQLDGVNIPVPEGSHYLCYRVEPFKIDGMGLFKDQFLMTDFGVLERRYICNPAIKRHNNVVYDTDIFDKENHLTCYGIEATDIYRRVVARDQFALHRLVVTGNDEVCIPTIKEEINDDPILCGEQDATGACPVATNCPPNTQCLPSVDGTLGCFCQ